MTLEKMSDSPDLGEVIRFAISHRLMGLHTSLPARVERYDPATQTADVVPVILQELVNTDELLEQPVCQAVPVLWPRAGGFFVSMPLKVGDFGLLLAGESETGVWRRKGGIRVAPQTHEKHSWSSAVFLPVNLYPDAGLLDDASADDMVIGQDGAAPKITLKPDGTVLIEGGGGSKVAVKADGTVELSGGGVVDAVALAAKVDAQMQALKIMIVALGIDMVALGVATGIGASTATAIGVMLGTVPPLFTPPHTWPGAMGAAKVKAE